MKFNLRAVLGVAVVAVVLAATGCGSLANNASALERNADGVVREGVMREGTVRENVRRPRHYRHTRYTNEGIRTTRRGMNRVGAQNRYLRQDDLTLRNGRFIGDGINPATRGNETEFRNVYNTPNPNYTRDLAHRTGGQDVVGTDGVVRTEGVILDQNRLGNREVSRGRRYNANNTNNTMRTNRLDNIGTARQNTVTATS